MVLIRDEIAGDAAAGKIFGNKDSFWKLLGILESRKFKISLVLGLVFLKVCLNVSILSQVNIDTHELHECK